MVNNSILKIGDIVKVLDTAIATAANYKNQTGVIVDFTSYILVKIKMTSDNKFIYAFIEELTKENMDKKLIGYKLAKPEYLNAALAIAKVTTLERDNPFIDFEPGSRLHRDYETAEVLDLWFHKVYEEFKFKKDHYVCILDSVFRLKNHNIQYHQIKKIKFILQSSDYNWNIKFDDNTEGFTIARLNINNCLRLATLEEINNLNTIIVKMTSASGDFELEISKNKIYYKPDKKELSVEFIKEIINCFDINSNYNNKDYPYTIRFDRLNIGSKKGTIEDDWKNVLRIYDNFNK